MNFIMLQFLWTFSILLEAVAILPQLFLLRKCNKIDVLTADYICLLGVYRALYMINWLWRWFTEENYYNWIGWICGIIQTILYLDFFYYYLKRFDLVDFSYTIKA